MTTKVAKDKGIGVFGYEENNVASPTSFMTPSSQRLSSASRLEGRSVTRSSSTSSLYVQPGSPRTPLSEMSERDLSPLSPLSPDSQTETFSQSAKTSQFTTKILEPQSPPASPSAPTVVLPRKPNERTHSQPRAPISQPTQSHQGRFVQQSVPAQKQRQREGSLRKLLVDDVLNKKLPLWGVAPEIIAPHKRFNPTRIPNTELDHFVALLNESNKIGNEIRKLEAQNPENHTEIIKLQNKNKELTNQLEAICKKYDENLDILRIQHSWGELEDDSWDLTYSDIINLPHADEHDIFLYNDLVGQLNKLEKITSTARKNGTPIDSRAVDRIKRAGLDAIEKAEQKADPEYSMFTLIATAILFVALFITGLGAVALTWPFWVAVAIAVALVIAAGLLNDDINDTNQRKEICKDKYLQIREAFMREGRFNKDEVESVHHFEVIYPEDDYFTPLGISKELNLLLNMPMEDNLENPDRLFIS